MTVAYAVPRYVLVQPGGPPGTAVVPIRGRVMVVTAAAARERGRGNGEVPEEISAHSLG
jgi:hypothetical protein